MTDDASRGEPTARGSEDEPNASAGQGPRADGRPVQERRAAARRGRSSGAPRTGALMVFALLVGGTAGWFGKQAQAQTARPEAARGSEGACQTWEQRICTEAGQEALACYEARAAANLLPPSACETALGEVPATMAKVAKGREVCNQVVTRLCNDLGPDSPTCGVVREKTELFPAERCQEMLDNYDQVIGELRMFQQQMGPGGAPPPGIEAPPGE